MLLANSGSEAFKIRHGIVAADSDLQRVTEIYSRRIFQTTTTSTETTAALANNSACTVTGEQSLKISSRESLN
jgi:hypothetical protein